MTCDNYFEKYERMYNAGDDCSRRLAYDELMHFYRENEASYFRLLRKRTQQDLTPAEQSCIYKMERIRNLLKL